MAKKKMSSEQYVKALRSLVFRTESELDALLTSRIETFATKNTGGAWLNEAHKLETERLADRLAELGATLRDNIQVPKGKKTMLQKVRKALGYTFP